VPSLAECHYGRELGSAPRVWAIRSAAPVERSPKVIKNQQKQYINAYQRILDGTAHSVLEIPESYVQMLFQF
jgi:hypothetical protein